MVARHQQLYLWSVTLHLPYSVWLPGLVNPISLLTAIKQVTARVTKVPLDTLTLDTHVTRMYRLADAVTLGVYPENGILVHGLFIEGARWTDDSEGGGSAYQLGGISCAGHLMDSKPKQLVTPMPVMYVRAVEVQDTWTWDCVGYLRNEADIYECPVYNTSARGSTFVFLSTLKISTETPVNKWVLAGVALVMQTDA
jgi:dynein heavy chain